MDLKSIIYQKVELNSDKINSIAYFFGKTDESKIKTLKCPKFFITFVYFLETSNLKFPLYEEESQNFVCIARDYPLFR